MGVTACTRIETVCPAPIRVSAVQLGVEPQILAQPPSLSGPDSEDLQLCSAPSLSQAEKLLLSPLRTRQRVNTRLGEELACPACVQINGQDVRPGTKIGSGTWSVVYAGEWRGARVALKSFRSAGGNAKEQERRWQMFLKEARTLQELKSPRVAKLFGVFVGSDGCPCLVMELLEGGTLFELLHGRRKSHKLALEPVHRFLLALHVAEGTAYLHGLALPVVHRDLKSKNVVIRREPPDSGPPRAAKIIDFGLAEYQGASEGTADMSCTDHGMHGSAVYMAPECFASPSRLSTKVDVWALGCVLAEIFGGAPPHTECEDFQQVIEKLLVQKIAPDIPAHADLAAGASDGNSVQQLLQRCFTFAVEERWNAAMLLESLREIAAKCGLEPLSDDLD